MMIYFISLMKSKAYKQNFKTLEIKSRFTYIFGLIAIPSVLYIVLLLTISLGTFYSMNIFISSVLMLLGRCLF